MQLGMGEQRQGLGQASFLTTLTGRSDAEERGRNETPTSMFLCTDWPWFRFLKSGGVTVAEPCSTEELPEGQGGCTQGSYFDLKREKSVIT